MRCQVIVDCETTSLFPDYATGAGVIWELAFIERDSGAERLWRMQPDVKLADQKALEVGRFRERTSLMGHATAWSGGGDIWDLADGAPLLWSWPPDLAPHVASLLDDVTLIAANPAFDAGFLAAFLNHHGQAATWHYRLRDIGSMAWAWLQAGRLPHHLAAPAMDAGTDDFAAELGVDPAGFERHSALGDCRLVSAMLQVMENGARWAA
jgi:hypothetical protein